MELNSVTSQAYPRAVNPGTGGQARRDHSGQSEDKPAAEQARPQPNARTAPTHQRAEREADTRSQASEGTRHTLPHSREEEAKTAFESARAPRRGPDAPHRSLESAPATVARRAERSYLDQVPTEQGRIIDEMV